MTGTPLKKTPAAMGRDAFVRAYGGVYEHSPWIAEAVFVEAPNADTVEGLHAVMQVAVLAAPHDRLLALIQAHPDLAVAPAELSNLTAASISEQTGAGLNQCTPEEFAAFRQLNADYRSKFGFPFIVAVKGLTRGQILAAFRARIQNTPEAEFNAALEEIHKIAKFRIIALQETLA
ncbi:MAG: 2-oxo-4-hydroxy-4-carboxy-5-ureidoimidazoline decarboxylase [Micavibrio sp.]|nr:2-oxo-4-hydroxy-4-carboxy-5-ureidoimidazoline decarboxylase [Micavibrio sp.]